MSAPEVRITDPRAVTGSAGERIRAYIALAKPRIIELLLVTTVPAMIVAAGEWPGTWLVVATVIGGTLSAGGANAINNYLDKDIDEVMRRTAQRPLPADRIEPNRALVFGIALGLGGFLWLWGFVNLPAALLSTGALLFYVFVYTAYLERSTVQNIVIGGAAGAVPVLVGWAAVTGGLDAGAWVMFAIVFYWTPPHFWALAVRYKKDYARAGVPMLPVVIGVQNTVRHILAYSVVLAGVSLLLYAVVPLGWLYLVTAAVMGAAFMVQAWRLRESPDGAMGLFTFSNVYLTVLFAAMALDVLVSAGTGGRWGVFAVAAGLAVAGQAAVLYLELRAQHGPRALRLDPAWSVVPSVLLVVLLAGSAAAIA